MNIHNIIKVYKRDFKTIVRNPVAAIVVAALCVIPSLYAWVNIKACWNVYENTSTIPVAVVNNDKGATFEGKKLNIGKEIIDQLKENHNIGWKFVNSRQAELGLVDSTYYAVIEIPQDFSSCFTSVLSENPKKPQIIYKADTKVNPVAGKITQVAKNTLVNQVTSNFVSTVNETIFSSLNILGKDADKNRESIIKMKDSIININNNMDAINGFLESVNSNSGNLSTFLSDLKATMPSVQNSLDVLSVNNLNNQDAIKSSQLEMNNALNSIDTNLSTGQASNDRIKGLFKSLNEAVSERNTTKINTIIPQINSELGALNDSIDVTVDYLKACNSIDFNSDIAKTIDSLLSLQTSLRNVKKQLLDIQVQLRKASENIDSTYDSINTSVKNINIQIDSLNSSISSVISALESSGLNNSDITQLIANLKSLQAALTALQTSLNDAMVKFNSSKDSVKEIAAALDNDISAIVLEIDKADKKIDEVVSFLKTVSANNTSNKAQIASIIQSLEKIQPYITDEKTQFAAIAQQLNSINGIGKSIADSINNDISTIYTQITTAQKRYNQGVRQDLKSISDNLITSEKDASELIASAKDLSSQIENIMGSAVDGSNLALKFSGDLTGRLLQFKDVIKTMSSKLELVNNNDIVQIISILQSNPKFMGDFMSDPFDIKDESINQIPNYGSSMTPIYTVLALWVGCLILNSILKPEPGHFEGVEKLTLREKHFGKMLTYSTLAVIQGLIASLGDKFLLHVYTVDTFLMITFAVVSSLTFSIITYTLVSTLGNVGKALGIIYMILQLAGSGGTYPIQVDPEIFRILQPLFPFTYSVGGFREAIAGPLVSSVALDFFALFLFAVVFLLFGFLFKEPLYKRVHKFEVRFKESGVGE